jgi:hypothetical protein
LKLLAALLLAVIAGAAAAQRTNNPEDVSGPVQQTSRNEEELRASAVTLPAPPKDGGLIEFKVSSASSFRFFVDAASLSLEPDREVRYTLVARSASGVPNVSYEGMRCSDGRYRVYAYLQEKGWVAQSAEWREPTLRWHAELRSSYFCPSRGTILSVAEGLDALRRGGHPSLSHRLGDSR